MNRVNIECGKRYRINGAYSEAGVSCVFAGRNIVVSLGEYGMAVVWVDGRPITGFTAGELGVYWDGSSYYAYNAKEIE